ncbi:hypothetical protein [Deinococcus soli (ex Cha et al. 2016)]|uniref:Uncharacterized protein n=2 Tax=Deinococcus soli (ex Cha et al. 2016) TaxID=1309411 RepID=A0AAE4BMB1_9DEIO|nr:hypothetical protein [Deinococcus soli (ex Cha et al. 2016)]MDR6218317.1 hypothetical protein [Deinococcus soli (ex Cha et al. 2016)]MDR6329057.1 hypothetical protein [Deinococcus soli (ex Cha et al. 2016)]MDR6751330.1 hypothetical protein [Deinococcus soli (ex Cha et al. 2016)]
MREHPDFRRSELLLASTSDIHAVRQAYAASLHPSDSFATLPSDLTRRNAWSLYETAMSARPRDVATFRLDAQPLHVHHVRCGEVIAYVCLPDDRPVLSRDVDALISDVQLGDRLVLAQAVGLCSPHRGRSVAAVTVAVTDAIPWHRSDHWSFLPSYGPLFTPADVEQYLRRRGASYRSTATAEDIETFGVPQEVTINSFTLPAADLPDRVCSLLTGCSAMDDDSFCVWVVRGAEVVQFVSWDDRSPVPALDVQAGDVVYGRHEHRCAADCEYHLGAGSFEVRALLT